MLDTTGGTLRSGKEMSSAKIWQSAEKKRANNELITVTLVNKGARTTTAIQTKKFCLFRDLDQARNGLQGVTGDLKAKFMYTLNAHEFTGE